MIEVHNLCKRFGKVQALAGASFTARDGVITALLGPNGAGKTTLLRTLVGLLQRDHGTISIDGVDPSVDPMAVRRNATAIIADGAITDNDDAAVEAAERAHVTLRTLRTVAEGLAGIHGRRKRRRHMRGVPARREAISVRQDGRSAPAVVSCS